MYLLLSVFQVSPWDKREEANEKKQAFALANSDHLALLQAYRVLLGLQNMHRFYIKMALWMMEVIFLFCRDGAALRRMATRPALSTAERTFCHGEAYRSGTQSSLVLQSKNQHVTHESRNLNHVFHFQWAIVLFGVILVVLNLALQMDRFLNALVNLTNPSG